MKNCGKYNNNLNLIRSILRKKRNQCHMSLEMLSSKLLLLGVNIPVTSLHRIENNQRTVRDYEICAFDIVFNIDVSELLNPAAETFKVS